MASSRLEKIGTIFSRVTGLLRSGAMIPENKPMWYDVYAAFPPKLEPRFDRPAPNIPLRELFYADDIVRAEYEKLTTKSTEVIDLFDNDYKTNSTRFVDAFWKLEEQGALDEEKIIEVAYQMVQEEVSKNQQRRGAPKESSKLVDSFTEAKDGKSVNIKDIFKE